MEAHLGVMICDKCREPMQKGQPVLIMAEGTIEEVAEGELTFEGCYVRYACHLSCWDGVEEPE